MPREFARKQLIYLTILAANGGFPGESTKFPVSTGKIVNFAPIGATTVVRLSYRRSSGSSPCGSKS
jgi:hypothetical protein